MTTTTATRIPLPPGAETVGEWVIDEGERVTRMFRGTTRGDRVRIEIEGEQDYSGRVVQRVAHVDAGPYGADLDADALRKLSADVLAAADEMDTLSDSAGAP
ncbi:hypothetical protein A5781_06150 [Mycobacterium sp. 852002-30065_SCH5024008]|nr:hypothetical protein A5781_06150 [Mycobacterium sp. 852002-30065_SCH5024008]